MTAAIAGDGGTGQVTQAATAGQRSAAPIVRRRALERRRAAASARPGPDSQPDRRDSFHGWVTTLVHQHRARLARVVRREGVRADDALDCVQEAFVSFLGLPQARLLVGLADDSARMLVILARNIARNRRRRHDYARPHVADDTTVGALASDAVSADDIVAAAEQYAMTLGCMTTLSAVQRAVVDLRLVDEVPGEDVARQLGITPGHLGVLMFRARQNLRRCVDRAEAVPAPAMTAPGRS
jgi:RNA polymerase sigma-70 factor (ECF subfamily)